MQSFFSTFCHVETREYILITSKRINSQCWKTQTKYQEKKKKSIVLVYMISLSTCRPEVRLPWKLMSILVHRYNQCRQLKKSIETLEMLVCKAAVRAAECTQTAKWSISKFRAVPEFLCLNSERHRRCGADLWNAQICCNWPRSITALLISF